MPMDSSAFDAFPVIFAIVAVIIAAVFLFVVVSLVRNARAIRRTGRDPLTLQADLATAALDSRLLAPAPSPEQRLHDLAALRQKNLISESEYAQARSDVIGGR